MPSQTWHTVGAQPRWLFPEGRPVFCSRNHCKNGKERAPVPRAPALEGGHGPSGRRDTPGWGHHPTPPPAPSQGPSSASPETAPTSASRAGSVFSSWAPACLPPPALMAPDSLFISPCAFPQALRAVLTGPGKGMGGSRHLGQRAAGRGADAALTVGPILQMRETEAQGGKRVSPARATELGPDPRNVSS